MCQLNYGVRRYIYCRNNFNLKETAIKQLIVIVATVATATVFASDTTYPIASAKVSVTKRVSSKPVPISNRPGVPKPKLLRSNPHRYSAIRLAGADPVDTVDDEDLYVFYRRQEIPKFEPILDDDQDDALSDYVKIRLLVARTRALAKHQETWS